MLKRVIIALMISLTLLSLAQARKRVRVALIPFDTERPQELGFLRDGIMDMLSSRIGEEEVIDLLEKDRLTKEVVEEIKRELKEGVVTKVADELKLDFIVYGSLKKFGDNISLDARMMNLKFPGRAMRFFVESEGMEGLMPRVQELAKRITREALEGVPPVERGDQIIKVEVRGARRLSPEEVLGHIKTRTGERFSRPMVQEDLKAIKALEGVAEVKALIRQTEEGVEITFELVEKEVEAPKVKISKISFLGLEILRADILSGVIKSQVGDPFSEEAIAEDLEVLRRVPEVETANVDVMDTPQGKEVFFIIRERRAERPFRPTISPPEERIRRIEIRGNRVIDSAAIRAHLRSRVGEIFSRDIIREDIKAVYKMGYFDDVRVELEETPLGKEITFVVVEKPVIADIRTDGNKKISTKDLLGALPFKARDVLNPAKVKEGLEKLKRLYEDKGYYAAEIDSKVEELPARQVRITFKIQEYEKVFVRKISFKGNKALSDRELKRFLGTTEKGLFSFITGSGTLVREKLKTDREILVELYAERGYILASVGEPEVKVDKKGIYITFTIDEGPQFRVGDVKITGDLIVPEEELRKGLKLASGQVFNKGFLRKDIEALTSFYTDRGFAFANVSPVTKLDQEGKKVDVTFDINKDRKVFVERINISGNTVTRDKVIRRQMTIAEGDVFSGRALSDSRRRLEGLQYFSKVQVATSPGSAPDRLNLDVSVSEAPTGSFSVGLGVSTQEGPSIFGEIRQRNFLGRGLNVSGKAQIGGNVQLFEISYFEPALFDSKWSFATDVFNTFRDFRDFNRDSAGLNFRFARPLTPIWGLGAGYRFESVKLSDLSANASQLLVAEKGRNNVSALSWDINRDTRDFPFDPSSGSLLMFTNEIAGTVFGGDNHFIKYIFDGRRFFPFSLFKRQAVFTVRGQMGFIQGLGREPVRVTERFFLGGIDTVRGYRPFSIGPRDPATDEVIGGTKELFFNAELLYPIWEQFKLKGIIFFDAGNTYAPGKGFDPTNLRKSFGFGVRFPTPFGSIRIEYGIALDRLKGDPGGRLEFRIGR